MWHSKVFNKAVIGLFSMVFAVIVLNSCEYNPKEHLQKNLVVATTGMIGDALEEILPSEFKIHTLMGPGVDPHLYEAKPSDITYLANAEAIVYNGLHLEGKMAELFPKLKREKLVVAIGDGLSEHALIEVGDGAHDPHIWLDPFIWRFGIEHMGLELMEGFPDQADEIMENLHRYLKEIDETGKWMISELEKIEESKRVLITSHDAFNYFGRAFDVQVEALQGISTVGEPGIKKVDELTEFIVNRKIASVFVESSVSSKAMKALKEACERKGYKIGDGGTLYSDAMGDESEDAHTYIKMLQRNTETIVKGLK